ncbi:MAG TPA: hypothetical protein DDW52_19005, partial [Planctomycetaceae bacterium]|nr:hypothetical protein [Planctomycetaceae bacterium]
MRGQLANCPKCQAAVLLEPSAEESDTGSGKLDAANPPAPPAQPPAVSVDSQAMTKEVAPSTFDNIDLSDLPASEPGDEYQLAPVEEALSAGGSLAEDDAVSGTPDAPEPEAASDTTEWTPGESPLVPYDAWTSESSSRTRQFLLIGVLGFTGVLLSVVGFFAFLSWYNKPDTDEVAGDPAQAETIVSPEPGTPSLDDTRDATDTAQPEDLTEPPPDVDASSDPESIPSDSTTESSSNANSVLPQGDAPDTGGDTDAGSADTGGTGEPSDTQASADASETAGDDTGGSDPTAGGLPEQLKAMESLLRVEIIPSIRDEGVQPTAPPVTAEELGLASTVELPPLEPVDVAQRMQASVYKLGAAEQVSLSKFLNMWTALSQIPVTVDFGSLASTGVDRDAMLALPPPSQPFSAATMQSVLEQTTEPLKLTTQVVDNTFIRLSGQDRLSELPQSTSIEGLVEAAQQAWMREFLVEFFMDDASLDASEFFEIGADALSRDEAKVNAFTWGEILRVIEKWRYLATGTTSDFVTQRPHFLADLFYDDASITKLNSVSELVSPQARPVGQIISRLADEAGMNVWFDWASLSQVGLGPSTTQAVVTYKRPLRRILADYARTYPFSIAILDGKSLWITSRKMHRSTVQVFVLPAGG